MSIENVKQFYQMVISEEDLRQKLAELGGRMGARDLDQVKAERMVEQYIIPLAAERGLPFTVGDFQQFNKELKDAKGSGELSAEELDSVAGGVGPGGGFCIGVGFAFAVEIGDAFCFIVGL